MLKKLLSLVFATLASLVFFASLSQPARAASFNVNTTTDTHDAVAGDGTCADSGGACSLRAATEEAAALAGDDTINIPNGTYVLSLEYTLTYSGSGSVTYNGQSTAGTIIDGGNNSCVRATNNGANIVKYQNLTIQNMITIIDVCTPIDFVESHTVINQVEIRNNTGYGIGFYNLSPTSYSLNINNSYIHDITSSPYMFGIYIYGIASVNIEGTTISNNTQTQSSYDNIGINIANGATANITNSTIAVNSGTANTVTGVKVYNASANLVNVTIAYNIGHEGEIPGGGGGLLSDSSTVTTRNVLLAGNTIGGTPRNCAGTITSLGGNMSSDSTCATQFNLPTDHNNVDPLLGSFGLHGGLTPTYALLSGSPAINAGVDVDGLTADQRGVSRIAGQFDIGAYEFVATSTTGEGTSNGSSSKNAHLPTVGTLYLLALPILLALLTTSTYIIWDWRRHRAPLIAENPHINYSLSHHISVVTIPKVRYRLGLVPKPMPTIPLYQ